MQHGESYIQILRTVFRDVHVALYTYTFCTRCEPEASRSDVIEWDK